MMESPASMAHVSSSYACAEDGYFKRPNTMSIDGDIWSDSGWFFVGFGVGGRIAWTFGTRLTSRQKRGKNNTP